MDYFCIWAKSSRLMLKLGSWAIRWWLKERNMRSTGSDTEMEFCQSSDVTPTNRHTHQVKCTSTYILEYTMTMLSDLKVVRRKEGRKWKERKRERERETERERERDREREREREEWGIDLNFNKRFIWLYTYKHVTKTVLLLQTWLTTTHFLSHTVFKCKSFVPSS